MARALRATLCPLAVACALAFALPAAAQEIRGLPNPRVAAPLDIVRAEIRVEQSWALFRMELRGPAGSMRPAQRGARAAEPRSAFVK